ncbi:hypothetical protein BGW38_000231 [Lunasporangiospora selenospora]|uniref:Mitochondrial carrier n=1 Tax=Lunasporangiospora selenospora TaxID=979761 RepID=A0A9P6KF40_9FUNG|nr:hypothetical protein BGW38_000231 [Lunasporangiospora selenospora]
MPRIPESIDHSRLDFHRYYVYATLLNVPPILVTYPFRTVRILQQSKPSGPKPVSTSVFKVIRNVERQKGFPALFAGAGFYTTGLTTTRIVQFATYDYTAQMVRERNYLGYPILRDSNILGGILGTFSAIVTTIFIVPFNMISQQIAIAKAGTLPNASNIPLYVAGWGEPLQREETMTLSRSLWSQYKQEGVRFLFRGYWATLWTTIPFFAAYFTTYEVASEWVQDSIDYAREVQAATRPNPNPFPPCASHQLIVSSVSGSAASMAAVLLSSPFDMVKTRIQTEQRLQPTNASGIKLPLPSLKWMDVARDIWKKEGPLAFFRGIRARAILTVPGGAFNFMIFDLVRSFSLKEVVPTPTSIMAERKVMFDTLTEFDREIFGKARDPEPVANNTAKKKKLTLTKYHPSPDHDKGDHTQEQIRFWTGDAGGVSSDGH